MNKEIIDSLVRHGFKPNTRGQYEYGNKGYAKLRVYVHPDHDSMVMVATLSALGIPVVLWDCPQEDIDDFEDYIRSVMPVR